MRSGTDEGWKIPLCLITGALVALLFRSLPPLWSVYLVSAACLIALLFARARWPAVVILACCWCLLGFHGQHNDRLDSKLAGAIMPVCGFISSPPAQYGEYLRFHFEPCRDSRKSGLPRRLLVYWYREWPQILVGQQWRLELRLRPPWGTVNFQGADRERWLFAQGIGGQGTVRDGQLIAQASGFRFWLQSLRDTVLNRVRTLVADERARGMVQALAVADRSGMKTQDQRLLKVTGTAHLVAISGLHVGLAAAGGIWLGRTVLWLLPGGFASGVSFALPAVVGLLTSFLYAGLAGFGTPTLRAVTMLTVTMVALILCRAVHPLRAWVIAFSAILLLDPFAPLGAGFWFSFMAVAALLGVFLPRTGRMAWWKVPMMAQAGVMVLLLPLSASWFHFFSPAGFLANLVAIPWVSLFVVPPVLGGIASLPISESLSGQLWSIAGGASLILLKLLEFIARIQGPLASMPPPSVLHLGIALLGGLLLLLPRGLAVRWGGLLLLAPLFLPAGKRTDTGNLQLEFLDVGQGTAVLISTADHTLLYDSGPGDGDERNFVSSVIAPSLARLGSEAPEHVVISHGDMDHAGGLGGVFRLYPQADYYTNLAPPSGGFRSCAPPLHWRWEGARFEVLHPSAGLPYLGNDSSCVISIQTGDTRVLLSGDISKVIENRLILGGIGSHDVLLVPHHGSETSSSREFISVLQPKFAVATASLGNRFDFPRATVRQRYEAAGAKFWSTGECGALRLTIHTDGTVDAISARRTRNRIWRWPVAENCP